MKSIVLLFLLTIACGCSSVQDAKLDQTSLHYIKATELGKRNPREDAEAFYFSGQIGYIMTTGGLIMPIGVKHYSSGAYYDSSLLDLELHQNPELKEIIDLLKDPAGTVTMFDLGTLSKEREHYLSMKGTYAKKFNLKMEDLVKIKANKSVFTTP